jgi:hypothetical protein
MRNMLILNSIFIGFNRTIAVKTYMKRELNRKKE